VVNLPVANPTSGANCLLGKIGSYLLQLEFTAMQREGRGEVISSLRVSTADNQEATIKVGQEGGAQYVVIVQYPIEEEKDSVGSSSLHVKHCPRDPLSGTAGAG